MLHHHNVRADALGPVTPAESDDARELGSGAGTKGQDREDSSDCASKLATRAAHADVRELMQRMRGAA